MVTGAAKSVVITGVSGFLGRHLARHFAAAGWSVTGVSSGRPESAPMLHLQAYHQMLLPSPDLAAALRAVSPTLVIHCAGSASVPRSVGFPADDFTGNVAATQGVLEQIRANSPASAFVLASSAAVYGDPKSLPIGEDQATRPISPYGYHKLICETICDEYAAIYSVRTVSCRIFSAYGPGLRRQVLWDLCNKLRESSIVELQGTGDETRDFVHVSDVCGAFEALAALDPASWPQRINVASGQETHIADLAGILAGVLRPDAKVRFDGRQPKGNPVAWRGDVGRLAAIGYVPRVPIDAGAARYAEWFKAEVPPL